MRYILRCLIIISTLAAAMLLNRPDAAKAESAGCQMADRIVTEAQTTLKTDPAGAVRLFIQAQSLCPDSATHNFNLGLAYFKYGDHAQAEVYLNKAISLDTNNPRFHNALAWTMLESGSNPAGALEHAQIIGRQPDPGYRDTLIRAFLANGLNEKALETAQQAITQWPNDSRLKERYSQTEDSYIAYFLTLAKEEKTGDALAGLEKFPQSGRAVEGRCWLLHRSGKTAEALQLAQTSAGLASSHPALKNTFNDIMDDFIQTCYARFQSGQRSDAWAAAKNLLQAFPSSPTLKEAEEKMVKAVMADAHTIDVPQPSGSRVAAGSGGGGSEALIADIRGKKSSPDVSTLEVDVEVHIPPGKDKRPDAIAVVIGNKHYKDRGSGIPDVEYADRDAAYMIKYLTDTLGYDSNNIINAPDATQGRLSAIFGTSANPSGQLYQWVKPGKSEVFIYYTGHGAPDKNQGGAYIVPVDADVNYLSNNGYDMDLFYSNIAQLPAKSVTVVMDACFSGRSPGGQLYKDISPALLKTSSPLKNVEKITIFSSAGSDQVSNWSSEKRHGLFTYYFLKGLGGDADKDNSKGITVAEMRDYLIEKVSYDARRFSGGEQTPQVAPGAGENFELVRLR